MIIQIKQINYGIACRIGNIIYINKKLKNYPELYNAILRHEKAHTSGFSWKDIILDINNPHLKGLKRQYYSFILKNPSSLVEFLPFGWYNSQIIINPLLTGLYGLISILIGGILWIVI